MNAVLQKQFINIVYVVFENLVDFHQIRHRLSCLIDDKAGAVLIREVLYAFRWHYLNELDVRVLQSDSWKLLIDQATKLIAVLVQMQQNEVLRIGLGDLSEVLVSRNLNDFSVNLLGSYFFDDFHAVGHVLLGELIIKI